MLVYVLSKSVEMPVEIPHHAEFHLDQHCLPRYCKPDALYNTSKNELTKLVHVRIQGGEGGSGPPWKITKYRVPKQCWSGSSQHSMLGHHRPFKWRFAGGPMMAR